MTIEHEDTPAEKELLRLAKETVENDPDCKEMGQLLAKIGATSNKGLVADMLIGRVVSQLHPIDGTGIAAHLLQRLVGPVLAGGTLSVKLTDPALREAFQQVGPDEIAIHRATLALLKKCISIYEKGVDLYEAANAQQHAGSTSASAQEDAPTQVAG